MTEAHKTGDDPGWRLVSPSGEELRLSEVTVTRNLAEVQVSDDPTIIHREYASTGTLYAVVHWPDP